MSPGAKKTWARAGRTPVVAYRDRHHEKVGAIGAVWVEPATGRLGLVVDSHPGSYVRGEQAAAFLHRVLAEHPGDPRVDVVWDNLQAHRSPIVRELLADHPRLHLHYLPPYAPDLNPVEMVWCLTKHHRTATTARSATSTRRARPRPGTWPTSGRTRPCSDPASRKRAWP